MEKIIYEILQIIEEKGYQSYLVGGYPRDYYLGRKTEDFDICTSAKPEEIKKLFPTILEENYGSLKIRYKDICFEITTFRLEQAYTSVRTPIITYTSSLEEDLMRRDFVMNTLCIDKNGNFIDILGAKADLDNKIIRAVGNPFQKMKEDPLRILRAIRFSSILNFTIEENLKKAILENKELVSNLSYYRKKEELDKILLDKNCNLGLQLLKDYKLDEILECTFSKIIAVPNLESMWAQISFSPNYPFTKKEKKEIETIKYFLEKGIIEDIDLYIYKDTYFPFIAQILNIDFKELKERYQILPIHSLKDIGIDISSIQEITSVPLSVVIPLLEKEIISGNIKNTKESIFVFLKEYFK